MFEDLMAVIKTGTDQACAVCRHLCRHAAMLVPYLGDVLRRAWADHRGQVNSNAAYAGALAAVAGPVVELFTHDPALLGLVAALVALYVAIHHVTDPEGGHAARDQYRPPTDPWGGGLDWR